jgi:hypothetical protein
VERGGAVMLRLLQGLRPVAEHLVAVALVAVAATPWMAVAEPPVARVGVYGAVAGATVVSLLFTRVLRTSARTEAIASLVGLVAFLLIVVLRDPLGGQALVRGLVDGLPYILSTTLPVLDLRWVLIPAAVVCWVGATAVTSIIGRSRAIAAPVGVALVVFLGGYAATMGGRGGDPAQYVGREALVLVGLLGLLAILRTEQSLPEGQQLRAAARVVLAIAVVAGSLGVAAVAVANVPYLSDEPVTPEMATPAAPREPTSPMLVTRELRSEDPDRSLASVHLSDDWSGYVPIAVLDRYDGRVWELTHDSFVPTGGIVPVEVPVGGGDQAWFDDVDLDATGGWLPFVARPSTVSGTAVLHNGGTALQPANADDEASYRLQLAQAALALDDEDLDDDVQVDRRAVPPLTVPDPAGDRRPAGERLCRLLAVARDPSAPREVGGEPCGRRGPDTVGFLRDLSDAIQDGRSVPEDLIGGRQLEAGSEALSDLLDLASQSGTQAAVGTPEQFASAYALVAHDFGLPARVVTGFRIEDLAPDGPTEIRGEHAWTWVEVPVEGVGWVVIDPAPTEQEAIEEDEQETAETEQEDEQEVVEQDRAVVGVDPTEVIGRAPPPEPVGPWVIAGLAVGGVLAVLLLLMLVAATRRWVRRRRRRRGDARERLLGAWHEAIDALYDVGHREVETLSAQQFIEHVSQRAPALAQPLPWFAEATNRAVFSTRPISDDEVARWWNLTRRLRVALRRSATLRRRLVAMLLPAPADLAEAGRSPATGEPG